MRVALTLSVGLALALSPAAAQDRGQTLADIRQELEVLHVELQRLTRELSTTGGPGVAVTGATTLERVDAIEAELQRLTRATEALQNRVAQVVADGTNRVGDLEFRICELEPGCEIGEIGETLPLGGEAVAAPAPVAPTPPQTGGVELAVGEQADFDRAREAFEAGDYPTAAERFATFAATYTGGPLTGEAHFLRGEALSQMGQQAEAARAYLASFSGSPTGARAPQALLRLGLALNGLGQQQEACVTLSEVTARYPESPSSIEAQTALADLDCT